MSCLWHLCSEFCFSMCSRFLNAEGWALRKTTMICALLVYSCDISVSKKDSGLVLSQVLVAAWESMRELGETSDHNTVSTLDCWITSFQFELNRSIFSRKFANSSSGIGLNFGNGEEEDLLVMPVTRITMTYVVLSLCQALFLKVLGFLTLSSLNNFTQSGHFMRGK